jgi:type I restriction enzyme M protein
LNLRVSNQLRKLKLRDCVINRKKGLSSYYLNGRDVKVPLINIKDIQGGAINAESIDYVYVHKTDILEESRISPGDIIISVRGSSFKVAVADETISNFVISSNLVALTPSNEIKPEFLEAYLESPAGQSQLQAFAGGATIKGLSLKALLDIEIPVPPLEQQVILSQYLRLVKEYNRVVKEELDLREKIKDAILMKYWGGTDI